MRLSASQRSSSLFSMVYYLCSGIFCAPCKHTYTSEFAASCRAPHRLSIKEAARLYQIPNPSIISLSLLYLFFFFWEMFKTETPISTEEHEVLHCVKSKHHRRHWRRSYHRKIELHCAKFNLVQLLTQSIKCTYSIPDRPLHPLLVKSSNAVMALSALPSSPDAHRSDFLFQSTGTFSQEFPCIFLTAVFSSSIHHRKREKMVSSSVTDSFVLEQYCPSSLFLG